ncbi:MAG: RHS repeat protein [Paludibacter sp.]|nr:RHS repeat protein [Paludibacter sp.]
MKRIIYTTLIVISIAGNIRAQREFGHVTPTTADFIKYGEVPVSLFTGKMNFEVPIYRIKDSDFDIPISLTYTSDGFKPAKRSGFVGLDWFLNVGGCITREVYGSPDDSYPVVYGEEVGNWWAIEGKNFTNNEWWNFNDALITCYSSLEGCNGPLIDGHFGDYQQDLFMFNFAGNSGQFMIDNQRNIKTNIKGYSVNFSSFSKQLTSNIIPNPSEITIQTPDGYMYCFGGDLSALEFSISFEPGVQPNNTKPTILAWHLTKITAPSGRSVKFNYTQVNITPSDTQKSSPIWQTSKSKKEGNSGQYNYSALKTVVLESIEILDTKQKVEFFKSQETGFSYYYINNYPDYNYPCYQLDSIQVSYNNQSMYSYSLKYETYNKRRFLSEFKNNDKSKYNFFYNQCTYPLPDVDTQSDFYGYWTSNNSESSYGLLTKTEYPTGGYTNFTYRKNQYNKRVEISLSGETNNLVTISGETGGARIYKMTNYNSNNEKTTEKTYLYTDSLGIGSGILYQYPPVEVDGRTFIDPQAWINNFNVGQSHIGYSIVSEQNADGSFIENRFSDFVSNPDEAESKLKLIDQSIDVRSEWLYTKVNRISSNASRRGLLKAQRYFDTNGNEVKYDEFSYRYNKKVSITPATGNENEPTGDASTNDIVSYRPIINGGMAKIIHLEYNPLIYKEGKINNVKNKDYFVYNDYDLVKEKKTIDSKSDTLRTYYKYPTDFATPYNDYGRFVDNNIINWIVEEKRYKNSECIFVKRKTYKFPPRSLLPVLDSIKMSIGDAPLRTIDVYHNYDNYSNPLFVEEKESTKIVYLWGYKGQYPIAKIENATYDNVKNALGGTLPESLSADDSFNQSLITNLRNDNVNLSNALITTYSYKPLVGLQTETDSRGVTTTYEYDTFNRLKCIKDTNGKIVKKFDYNYKH